MNEGEIKNLFRDIKSVLISFITSRIFGLMVFFPAMFLILLIRLFDLQIVRGEDYLENFVLMIQKDRSLSASRGNIYDKNGELLAYNKLAYSVEFEDIYEDSANKDLSINNTIFELIKILDMNNDEIISDFPIILNENNQFEFTIKGTTKERFIADVYAFKYVDDLKKEYAKYTSTADEIIQYLASEDKYEIGSYKKTTNDKEFQIGYGYNNKELLKLISVRYAISKNAYQKFISTTIAIDASPETVAMVLENSSRLQGVSIKENSIRKYVDAEYFSHIIGYVAGINQSEYEELNAQPENITKPYYINDLVGKSGIEKVMESQLRGINGSEMIHVDKMGAIIDTSNLIKPIAGNDLYLTIDKKLQIATYKILEQKLAGILIEQIVNTSETYFTNAMINDKKISIDEVYFSFFNNNILSFQQMFKDDASEYEKIIVNKFNEYQSKVIDKIELELLEDNSLIYKDLSKEYQIYQSYISNYIIDNYFNENLDVNDEVYIDWKTNEIISMKEFLLYSISMNWVDITSLDSNSKYLDKEEIYLNIVDEILQIMKKDDNFSKKIIDNMIKNDQLSPKDICFSLWKQEIIDISSDEYFKLSNNNISTFNFIIDKIKNLEITPAQLALEPCSASCVITEVNTGKVLAMVSYPSYDNNYIKNSVYYNKLNNDLSRPLWNYATQQKTAPGSTFKPISTAAILEENVATENDKVFCKGIFDTLDPPIKCWVYPSAHGDLNAINALEVSCNSYFCEMIYRMSLIDNSYSSVKGIDLLSYYATLFGLDKVSGVEIIESEPELATELAIPASMGQSNHNFTTVGLARYVNAIANKGTTYELSLLSSLKTNSGTLLEKYTPKVEREIKFNDTTWETIHSGMELAANAKLYFASLPLKVAGKTGTAQENLSKADHALFIGYAPIGSPEISIATRIANGYTSNYAAEASKDIFKYYFKIEDSEDIITNEASDVISNATSRQD